MSDVPDPRLAAHRRIWDKKRTLRILYGDYHRRLFDACGDGPVLDIGGGSGHSKDTRSNVISLDILPFPGIDVVCDAHRLPFSGNQFAGVVMLDVLHHLEHPVAFLREAARVLRPGGVLAMIEPGMSPVAYTLYRYLHHEVADMSVDPFVPAPTTNPRDPFDSNQAIPTLLFDAANRQRLSDLVPELTVRPIDWLSLIAFPLSGGFQSWCLMPPQLAAIVVRLEDKLPLALRRIFGFRIFATLEKTGIARAPAPLRELVTRLSKIAVKNVMDRQ